MGQATQPRLAASWNTPYGAKGGTTMVIAGARVLVEGMSLRQQGIVPGMPIELKIKLHAEVGDSQPLVVLAIFRV